MDLQQPFIHRLSAVAALALSTLIGVGARAQAAAPTFDELAPILSARCTMCHSGDSAAAGLRLDSLDGLLKGSARGPVVKAGDAAGSELMRRLQGTSQPRMPMTGPPYLADDQIDLFRRWIVAGLPKGSATASAATPPPRPAAGEPVTYLHVAPIFARRCAKCHTDNGQMGAPPEGYRLTSHAATLDAADRARVVPGQPAASELMRRVRGQSQPRMPFDGPPWLADEEITLIERWIAQGARDADGQITPIPVGARVRLHGVLGAGWQLDGLPLAVGAGTRIDKQPREGDRVEVRGRLDAAGHVVVDRLRRR